MNRRGFLRWLFTLGKPDPKMAMPDKFRALAEYNGEVARGIVHTEPYDYNMVKLQDEFEAWAEGLDPDTVRLF